MSILDKLLELLSPTELDELRTEVVSTEASHETTEAQAAPEAPAEGPTPAELLDLAEDARPLALRVAEAMRTGNTDLVERVRAGLDC